MIFLRFYMEFTSLLFLKTKEKGKEILHLDPWISVSSPRRSLAGLGTEEEGRGFSRRGEAPAVGGPLGKSERGPRTTSRRFWGSRWWPAAVAPRRGADGGGSALARRHSAGHRAGRPGRRASVEVWEGGGVAGLGNGGLGRPDRNELSSSAALTRRTGNKGLARDVGLGLQFIGEYV